ETDDPDITIKEYVQLETERALRNAIVYNDALASKLDFSSEPTVSPQHVDEINTDNDNDDIDIKQYSGDIFIEPLPNVTSTDIGTYAQGSNKLLEPSHDIISKIFTAETFIKKVHVMHRGRKRKNTQRFES
ncbi:hypothetical protein Tco_0363859, partial [Tanacetum coccineum]